MAANTCSTFLSENVTSLLQETYSAYETTDTGEVLPLIATSVIDITGCPSAQWTAQDYRRAIKHISCAFQQITHHFQACQILDESMHRHLEWTRNENLFRHIYALLRHPEHATSVPLGILLCSATLERALGNVYLIRGAQVPSLMKDLLASPELQHIFGKENMSLLQIIIGPPLSLNIRNILWHGFATPEEIPVHLGFFLFFLVLRLGNTLEKQGFKPKDLPFRALAKFEQMVYLRGVFPDFRQFDHIAVLQQLFASSKFIPKIMLPYWQGALEKFVQNRYGEFLILLLPQLEHSLRCLFTVANNCPLRMLTAESAEFYTTFDEILATTLSTGQSNKLIEDFDEQFLSALLDILVYPDGPRIRDRASHGEIDVDQIPYDLANHILGLSTAFCVKLLPCNHPLNEDNLLQSTINVLHNYKPIFHPSAIVITLIQELVENCSYWPSHQVTSSMQPVAIEAIGVAGANQSLEWQDILIKLLSADNSEEAFVKMKHTLNGFRCKTFHRPKWEWEVLLQMRRILNCALTTSKQILLILKERSGMIEQRQLRSRQRATYHRMLACIPTIKAGLLVVAAIMCLSLISINQLSECDAKERERQKRLLNHIEKCSENLKTLTDQKKNRWEESKEIVLKLLIPEVCKHYKQT